MARAAPHWVPAPGHSLESPWHRLQMKQTVDAEGYLVTTKTKGNSSNQRTEQPRINNEGKASCKLPPTNTSEPMPGPEIMGIAHPAGKDVSELATVVDNAL
ncbi:hypothetical protein Y1Q_0017931 [Alligator mississippiensis]|uniref:Uncharacterized protein n=1 Tax=Alligator mississippiensis TaxID=8496 RepID=A0A151MXQ5_ALLMI|nr:hypothetical protein Y1Q_0017931 [Alligator mississippiensis]